MAINIGAAGTAGAILNANNKTNYIIKTHRLFELIRLSRFRHVSQCTVEKSLNEYLTATQALTFDLSPAVYQLTSNLPPATSRGQQRAACSSDQSTVTYLQCSIANKRAICRAQCKYGHVRINEPERDLY